MLRAVILAPSLSIDFAVVSASTDRLFARSASVEGKVGFSVLAGSPVSVQNPAGTTSMGTPGWLRPKEDVVSAAAFAKVEEGGAALVDLQAAEELQLHTLAARGLRFQRKQRFVHGHHVVVEAGVVAVEQRGADGLELGVALGGAVRQGVVDQDAPHHGAGNSHEVAAANN